MKPKIVQFPENGQNANRSGDAFASVLFGMENLLQAGAVVPALISQIEALNTKIDALRTEISERDARTSKTSGDGWLDSKNAAKYLGISSGCFEKYRYSSAVKIKGFPLDGKVLFKREDLDNFDKLYAVKLHGLA